MHRDWRRSRNAQRQRSFRSCADLGRIRSVKRVSHPPPKSLIIWDGECHFCRRWIERWKEITRGKVDYETSQQIGERFPEISREQFERSVILIEADGADYFGAEAVFRSLRCRSSRKWLSWSYDHVPGFAPVSEFFS